MTYNPETEIRTGREYDRSIARHTSVFSGVRAGGISSSAKRQAIQDRHRPYRLDLLSDRINNCSHYHRTARRKAVWGKIPVRCYRFDGIGFNLSRIGGECRGGVGGLARCGIRTIRCGLPGAYRERAFQRSQGTSKYPGGGESLSRKYAYHCRLGVSDQDVGWLEETRRRPRRCRV